MSSACTALIVAGEVSGDLHAAPVVSELKRLAPEMSFFGAGGEQMGREGVELLANVSDLAVMGFTGVPKILPRLAKLRSQILQRVEEERVPIAILVDYPGFNLRLAKSLKSLPHPPKILYYIAPQLWAWKQGRVKQIRQYIDKLAVVFEFEIEFFRKFGVEASFVGHPLLDEMAEFIDREKADQTTHSGTINVAILPGSRPSVAARHLPILIEAANLFLKTHTNAKITFGRAGNLLDSPLWTQVTQAGFLTADDSRELLSQADIAVVCSGTATLEAALIKVPQVVVYQTSPINYWIAKTFVKIPNVALANLTAGRTIVRELLQNDLTAKNLASEMISITEDTKRRSEILAGYGDVRKALGSVGAARRVAEIGLELCDDSHGFPHSFDGRI